MHKDTHLRDGRRKPRIVIGSTDYSRLDRLATTAASRMPEVAEELLSELDRARIVPDSAVPEEAVRMGSAVEFQSDTGGPRTVSLVFPEEADIAGGRISILTPVGTALIGLAAGQSITWAARDGKRHELTVLSVRQQAPSGSALEPQSAAGA